MTALPEHSHDAAEYPVAQGCPRCIALAAVNPDTGTPWPPLSPADDDAIADAAGRFHDRLDGPDYSAALHAALTEAYLRGMMRGRLAEVASVKAAAARHEEHAAEQVQAAARALTGPGSLNTLAAATHLAQWHTSAAQALRVQAGSR